ncbi:hypothetical protein EJB05_01637, partial [Eragrostis curvula]
MSAPGRSAAGSQAPRPPRSSTPSTASKRPRSTRSSTPTSSAQATPPSSEAAAMPSPAPAEPTAAASDEGTDVVDIDDDVPVGGKRKLKSDVWLEFERVLVAGKLKAKCSWCQKLLSGTGTSGTSHLRGHLSGCASRQVQLVQVPRTMKEMILSLTYLISSCRRNQKSTQLLFALSWIYI